MTQLETPDPRATLIGLERELFVDRYKEKHWSEAAEARRATNGEKNKENVAKESKVRLELKLEFFKLDRHITEFYRWPWSCLDTVDYVHNISNFANNHGQVLLSTGR